MKTDERTKMTMMDMDARSIGIDNRCTACISHRKTDFIGDIHKKPNHHWIWRTET